MVRVLVSGLRTLLQSAPATNWTDWTETKLMSDSERAACQ
jgi:hypothetical protein